MRRFFIILWNKLTFNTCDATSHRYIVHQCGRVKGHSGWHKCCDCDHTWN